MTKLKNFSSFWGKTFYFQSKFTRTKCCSFVIYVVHLLFALIQYNSTWDTEVIRRCWENKFWKFTIQKSEKNYVQTWLSVWGYSNFVFKCFNSQDALALRDILCSFFINKNISLAVTTYEYQILNLNNIKLERKQKSLSTWC